MKGIHRYANQRLQELNNEVSIQLTRILTGGKKVWETPTLQTALPKGETLAEEGNIEKISYDDLNRMGFIITRKKVSTRYFKQQQVIYAIDKKGYSEDIGKTPAYHEIQYDAYNQVVRIMGRNTGPLGAGPWIKVRSLREKQERRLNLFTDTNQIHKQLMSKYMPVEEEQEYVHIPEIPVMISNQGEVICLEEARDEPVIGIAGGRGSGKTLLAHSIIDRAYWKLNKRVAILNDSLNQCTTWNLPSNYRVENGRVSHYDFFENELNKINEHPLPLPCVYLHPTTDTLRDTVLPGEGVSFKISLPFESVIRNYSYFFKGKKEWDLGKTAAYFRPIKEHLENCKDVEAVDEKLQELVEEGKLNSQSAGKILTILTDVFNQNILDVTSDVHPYWRVRSKHYNGTYNPVISCLNAGVIPVIMTQNLLPKDYFPQFMRYYIDSIFDFQIDRAKQLGQATWVFVDEIADVSSTTNKTVAAESLRRIVTEGRNPKLGTIFATQNWTKIDPLIRNNTTHLFSYANKSREAGEIAKDFDLADRFKKNILNLKKFEMVAMTKEKWVCYDSEGNRYKTDEPITGRAVMPLSQHQQPGEL